MGVIIHQHIGISLHPIAAESIAVKTELVLNRINALLSDKNLAHIEDVLLGVKEISGRVNTILDDNDAKVAAIIDDLSRVSSDLEKGVASAGRSAETIESMLSESRPRVAEILSNLNQTTITFKATAKDLAKVEGVLIKLEATLTKFNNEIQQVDIKDISDDLHLTLSEAKAAMQSVRNVVNASSENIYQSSDLLKSTLLNLEEVSDQLRDQPSLLLMSRPALERND